MLEKVLLNSRYLVIVAVVFILLSAFVLYGLTTFASIITISRAIAGDWDPYSLKVVAASFLKIVDFFLICAGLQIIAAGIYKLFVNNDIELPGAMNSESFIDLKLTLVKLAAIILLLDFVEHALRHGPSLDLLYYGVGIGAVLVAVSWGANQLTLPSIKSGPTSD